MNSNPENPLTPPLALGGALLLLISLFLDWFSLSANDIPGADVSIGFARPDTATLLFVIVIAVAIGVGAGRMRGLLRGQSTLLVAAGGAAFLYALVNLIKKPQLLDLASSTLDQAKKQGALNGADVSIGTDIGLYIALLGSLLLLGAGLMELLGLNAGSGPRAGAAGGPGGGGFGAGPSAPPAAPPAAGAGVGGFGGAPGGGATQLGATAPAAAAGGPPPPADTAPGWQPDPHGQARLRYWDGNAWTEHTSG
jgi:hypothetical protein